MRVSPSGPGDIVGTCVLLLGAAVATSPIPIAIAWSAGGLRSGRDLISRETGVRLSIPWFIGVTVGAPTVALLLGAIMPGGVEDSSASFGSIAQVLATLIVAVVVDLRASMQFVLWGGGVGARWAAQIGLITLLVLGTLFAINGVLIGDLANTGTVRYDLAKALALAWSLSGIAAALVLLGVSAVSRILGGEVPPPGRQPPRA